MNPAFVVRRPWRIVLFAWIPLAVLYVLAIVTMSRAESVTVIPYSPVVIPYSLIAMVLAGALAFGIWWLTGRIHWPARLSWTFYATHLSLGVVHGVVWFFGSNLLRALLFGKDVSASLRMALGSPFLVWNVLFGLIIYALWASMSYAVRERNAHARERVDAARAEVSVVRSQLTALEAQLNPHFLFNALNSLAALVRSDASKAEAAIDCLGDLMRYALDRSGTAEVLLADEWEFVENYLSIEQLRLDGRLVIETTVDPCALTQPVPPFSLQPLVENAVRHGIEPRPEGGTISIRIQSPGSVGVVMEVEDDGFGADPTKAESAPGFGLRTLRERLALGTRVQGSLSIQTRPGGGFGARVEVAPCGEECQDLPGIE